MEHYYNFVLIVDDERYKFTSEGVVVKPDLRPEQRNKSMFNQLTEILTQDVLADIWENTLRHDSEIVRAYFYGVYQGAEKQISFAKAIAELDLGFIEIESRYLGLIFENQSLNALKLCRGCQDAWSEGYFCEDCKREYIYIFFNPLGKKEPTTYDKHKECL